MVKKKTKAQENISKIIHRLRKKFPEAGCTLNYENPLELLIATILSAQCTDARVNIVTQSLFQKYRRAEDFIKIRTEELEKDIRSTGFYRNKAKSIQGTCKYIIENFGGKVPDVMEDLLTLPGVARKTANVVLGNAYGLAEGVAVDTHVQRISKRLGLTKENSPQKIEVDLMGIVPRDEWIHFSHLLILHGRTTCKALRPLCSECILEDICPKIGVKKRC
jgi:endonuclease-3